MIQTITIQQTDRGYVVEFPHKPSDHAIKGFHMIGMSWRSADLDGRVFWRIPVGKLDEAMDFINYWFNIKGSGGYVITVADLEEAAEVEAA